MSPGQSETYQVTAASTVEPKSDSPSTIRPELASLSGALTITLPGQACADANMQILVPGSRHKEAAAAAAAAARERLKRPSRNILALQMLNSGASLASAQEPMLKPSSSQSSFYLPPISRKNSSSLRRGNVVSQ
jgi:hypothetical protein